VRSPVSPRPHGGPEEARTPLVGGPIPHPLPQARPGDGKERDAADHGPRAFFVPAMDTLAGTVRLCAFALGILALWPAGLAG